MPTDIRSKKKGLSKKLIIQLLVSAVLLFLIFRKLDSSKLIGTLERVSPLAILELTCIYLAGQLVSATKWRILVRSAHIERTWGECVRAYILGMFVNSFGLGTVGGDVTRALALKPEKGKRAAAFASVIADRIHGLGVLVTIGAIGIAFVQPAVLGPHAGLFAWIAVIGLTIAWFFGPLILVRATKLSPKFGETAVNISRAFPTKPKLFFAATFLSVILHTSQLYIHYLMARALGIDLSMGYIFATIPIVNAASSLPVSIQGLGVREGAYLFLLTPLGIEPEVCVAFGALWFLTAQVVSALAALTIAPGLLTGKNSVEDLAPEEDAVEDNPTVMNSI